MRRIQKARSHDHTTNSWANMDTIHDIIIAQLKGAGTIRNRNDVGKNSWSPKLSSRELNQQSFAAPRPPRFVCRLQIIEAKTRTLNSSSRLCHPSSSKTDTAANCQINGVSLLLLYSAWPSSSKSPFFRRFNASASGSSNAENNT